MPLALDNAAPDDSGRALRRHCIRDIGEPEFTEQFRFTVSPSEPSMCDGLMLTDSGAETKREQELNSETNKKKIYINENIV